MQIFFKLAEYCILAISPRIIKFLTTEKSTVCIIYLKNLGNFYNSKYGENIFVCKFICIRFSFH